MSDDIHAVINDCFGGDLRALARLGALPANVIPGIVRDAVLAARADVLYRMEIMLFAPAADVQHVTAPWMDIPADAAAVAPRPYSPFVRGATWDAPDPQLGSKCSAGPAYPDSSGYVADLDRAWLNGRDGQPLDLAVLLRMKSGDVRVASWPRRGYSPNSSR